MSTILLVGGLGVEDQSHGACAIPLVLHVISFSGIQPKKDQPHDACAIPLVLHVISFSCIQPKTKFTDQYQEILIYLSHKNCT
jgi:hypothetical protein